MSLVTTTIEGRVATITLSRPEQRNALSAQLRIDLIAALDAVNADGDVGAIVLTGAGKCFAAGADLAELQARTSEEQRAFLQPPHIYSVIEDGRKPVIAAINGHALGAGLELATACDYRVAAPHAKLGQPEINLALIPGGGGTQRLARLVGPGMAAKMVMTGHLVSGDEARDLRLVDEVADDPVAAAETLAARIAAQDPEAIHAAKEALHAAVNEPYDDGLRVEIDHFVRLHARPESQDRIRAFLEK